MAVKPTTQQGQWVCFGPDRAFAYKKTDRVISVESTPNGWYFTVELEARKDANSKLQEVKDTMVTEKRLEKAEEIEHTRALPQVIKQMLTGRKDLHPFGWQGTDSSDHVNDRWNP